MQLTEYGISHQLSGRPLTANINHAHPSATWPWSGSTIHIWLLRILCKKKESDSYLISLQVNLLQHVWLPRTFLSRALWNRNFSVPVSLLPNYIAQSLPMNEHRMQLGVGSLTYDILRLAQFANLNHISSGNETCERCPVHPRLLSVERRLPISCIYWITWLCFITPWVYLYFITIPLVNQWGW